MLMNFLKRHSIGQVVVLICEEYIGALFRYLPGYEGMLLRRFLLKLLCKKGGKSSMIWSSVFITHAYKLELGSFVSINVGAHLDARGGLSIGNHVMIGPNVFIGSSNHVIPSTVERPRYNMGHKPKPVVIGSNIWIGANAVICPGARIGDNSIIAAGSIVRGEIPENVIVQGPRAEVLEKIHVT